MWSRGSRLEFGARTKRGLTLTWLSLFILSLLLQYGSLALPSATLAANTSGSKSLGGFEIDGDFPAATSLGGDDWSNHANTGAGLVNGPTVQDPLGNADATVLSNGVSDGDPLTDWQMNGSAGAPQKADMGNVYVATRPVPTPATPSSHFYTYVGIERKASTGTVQYDLEFNKLPNRVNAHGVSVPNRETGDLLFTGTQQGGGSWVINGTVQVWTGAWDTGSWGPASAIPDTQFYGLANEFAAPHPTSWPDALGSTVPINQFAEMAIDLTAAVPNAIGCPGFGALNIRSISSTGQTPELKDVVAAIPVDVSNCASLAWQKQDDAGNPLGGATFTISPNPWTGAAGSVDITDLTSGSPANAQSDQDNRAGFFKLIDVKPNVQYTVTEKTAPANYLVDPTSEQITPAVFQDASISYVWKNPPYSHPGLTTSLVGGTDAARQVDAPAEPGQHRDEHDLQRQRQLRQRQREPQADGRRHLHAVLGCLVHHGDRHRHRDDRRRRGAQLQDLHGHGHRDLVCRRLVRW